MNANLLFKDKSFMPEMMITEIDQTVIDDLWLGEIIKVASNSDRIIEMVYKNIQDIASSDLELIIYRQGIVKDSINNRGIIIDLYNHIKKSVSIINNLRFDIATSKITQSLGCAVNMIKEIRPLLDIVIATSERNKEKFNSQGFQQLFKRIKDYYGKNINNIEKIALLLDMNSGLYAVGGLDNNLSLSNFKLYDYDLNNTLGEVRNDTIFDAKMKAKKRWKKAPVMESPLEYDSTKEEFYRQTDLALKEYAIKFVPIAEEMVFFFRNMQYELAFYIGAINLFDRLSKKDYCYPEALDIESNYLFCNNLYDVALFLKGTNDVIGNDLKIDNPQIVVISGANQGGKTTFLRSYGQSQIMMQCGLFVGAKEYKASICSKIYTHFNKEEDKLMVSGRLDSEIKRLKAFLKQMKPNSSILFNESFASTSEKEGANLAMEIIRALIDSKIKIIYVTHMFTLSMMIKKEITRNVFFQAERKEDGKRTYHLILHEPTQTSYAIDLFNNIFTSK